MKKSIKGALLSAFVYPGLGQIKLGYYVRGYSIAAVFTTLLVIITMEIMSQAQSMIDQIIQGDAASNINTIISTASQAPATSGSLLYNIMSILICICWLAATIDAYRLGKTIDYDEHLSKYGL